jgi:diguanylate cyclase (GGDEF)-like protein
MNDTLSNELLTLFTSRINRLNKQDSSNITTNQESFDRSSVIVQALINIPNGILIIDNNSNLLFINKVAKKIFNCKKNTYTNQHISFLINNSYISIKQAKDFQYTFTYSNNNISTYNIEFKEIVNNTYLMVTFKDETKLNKTKTDLLNSNFKYNLLINNIPDILLQLNEKGDIIYYNQGQLDDSCFNPDQYHNKNIFEVFPIEIAKKIKTMITKVLSSNDTKEFKSSIQKLNKTYHSIIRIYPNNEGEVICLIRDISEQILIENKLEYLNIYDSLTGLFNRTYFENRLSYYNDPAFLPMGLVICDLNGLKLVNDTLGHSYGDIIIKESANIIKLSLSNYEEACRIGGDEFAIFFPNCSESLLIKYKDNVVNKLNEYNESNPKLPLSFSIGYSIKSNTDVDMNNIFIVADNNMYHDKLLQGIKNRNAIIEGLIQSLSNKEYKNADLKSSLYNYVMKLAKAINYPEQNMENLKLFVNFHDLGQVSISNKILYKQEPLTEEEINIIKRHSEVGYKISLSIPNLFHIADWILKHHEWWNGEGYPLNIKGNEIPVECRVFAIVESYIAMISEKPYKKAISKKDAISELKRCSSKQFDPLLVDKFIDIIKQEL